MVVERRDLNSHAESGQDPQMVQRQGGSLRKYHVAPAKDFVGMLLPVSKHVCTAFNTQTVSTSLAARF